MEREIWNFMSEVENDLVGERDPICGQGRSQQDVLSLD